MSPTTSRGKSGKRYRYYVSTSLQQGAQPANADLVQCLSAPEIEGFIGSAIKRWALKVKDPFASVRSVCLSERGLQVAIDAEQTSTIASNLADDEMIIDRTGDEVTVFMRIRFALRGGKHLIFPASSRPPRQDQVLIAALRKAHTMLQTERGMPLIDASPSSPHDQAILSLAFLGPDIQRAILDGHQPLHLNLEKLKKKAIPPAWSQQRKVLGFAEPGSPCLVE